MEGTFKDGDFVWAKLGSYSHWPAIVRAPHPEAPPKASKDMQWIYFLGTYNYAWIENRNIKPYQEFEETFRKKNIKNVMLEMDDIIAKKASDPKYEIEFVPYVPKRSSPKKVRKSSGSIASGEKKRPLKEKNTPVPKKKQRSVSHDSELNVTQKEIQEDVKTENINQHPVVLNTLNLGTSNKIFGFLAGSVCAEGIIKNLIKSGHKLYVWSRSSSLCEELSDYATKQKTFFSICDSPRRVVQNADITFSCLADTDQVKLVTCQLGITDSKDTLLRNKRYVEMTSMDPATSENNAEFISKRGGLYIEAMLQGNKQEANKGELIVLVAGSQSVFVECQSCFKAMSKASFLLGKIGTASKIHMIFQMMRGVFLASLVEGFAMADRCSIKLDAFNNIFRMTHLSSDYLRTKSETIVSKKFSETEEPVEKLQKDLALGLEMSNTFKQPMPLASNANEILKHARRLGCDNQDSACIYNRTRY